MLKTLNHELFAASLLRWWRSHRRNFPWRKTKDPYQIIVAEILLHRTKADQVAPVFKEFIRVFPNARSLNDARGLQVESALASLGLFWRTKLLKLMALELMDRYGGYVPYEKEQLLSLPGVGPYVASAVRCFSFDKPEPILDTNTVRIIGRLFGLKITDSSRRSKLFQTKYMEILDTENAKAFNFAMLDLANMVCKSKEPVCRICPILTWCHYGTKKTRHEDSRGKATRAEKFTHVK